MGDVTELNPKTVNALEGMSTEDKRAAMQKVVERAQDVWEQFGKRATSRFEKPSARDCANALLAVDCLLRTEQGDIWANLGVGVQEARTAVKAIGELGRGLLGLIKELEHQIATLRTLSPMPGEFPALDTSALETALGLCDTAAAPQDLPEGSTRTDPIVPVPSQVEKTETK